MSSSNTVVLQFNNHLIKYGYAGDTKPWQTLAYNNKAKITNNLELIQNRLNLIQILKVILIEKLFVKLKECRIVIIEDIFSIKLDRDLLLTCLVYDLCIKEITIQADLFTPILTSNNMSGIVIDMGFHSTKVIAIYQGRPLLHTLKGILIHSHIHINSTSIALICILYIIHI